MTEVQISNPDEVRLKVSCAYTLRHWAYILEAADKAPYSGWLVDFFAPIRKGITDLKRREGVQWPEPEAKP